MLYDQKCSECGAPASSVAGDVQEDGWTEKDGKKWVKYRTKGNTRYGCDKHPVQSRTFDTNGKLMEKKADD